MPTNSIDQNIDDAVALHQAGKLDAAEKIYRHVLSQQPAHPDVLHLLGVIATQTQRPQLAVELISKAIAVHPAAIYYNNLGKAARDLGELDQASDSYRRAILIKPDYFEAHNNLAVTLREMEQLDESIAASRTALRLKPDYPQAHWSLALSLLLKGDFENGWREYEWRLRCAELPRPMNLPQPRWDGTPQPGKTILLHTEQGYGDMLQFARYTHHVAQRCAKVILACPPKMLRLMQSCPGAAQVIEINHPLPPFDLHCPIGSLPLIFSAASSSIPAPPSYLKADDELISRWRTKLLAIQSPSTPRLRCGIVWSGNPLQSTDRRRSLTLDLLAPLLSMKSVEFHSLQKGPAAEQIQHSASPFNLVDHASELHDFADTAAVIANLDLVITVDTAVAHLAGAVGKPVWVMLSRPFDWRYLLDRDDTPWYPSMRLFRQTQPGRWDDLIARVAGALETPARN